MFLWFKNRRRLSLIYYINIHSNYSNFSKHLCNNRFKLVTFDLSDSQSIDNAVRESPPVFGQGGFLIYDQ